jgi:hypothetical protein
MEDIPDKDFLYRRIHNRDYRKSNKVLAPRAFTNMGNGMSSDWNKYSTTVETRNRAKDPENWGVISLNVRHVRSIPEQYVNHTPSVHNQAHTDIVGPKVIKIQLEYLRIYQLEIEP